MRYFYILCFLLGSNLVCAQTTGSISGKVLTSEGTPVEFVNISLQGTLKGAVTGKDGFFQLKEIAPGSYTLVASLVGFELYEELINIDAGGTVQVDISLHEAT